MTVEYVALPRFDGVAACASVDPETFFAEAGGAGKQSVKQAREICGGCEIRQPCLKWALDNAEPFGVWGGLTEAERRRLTGRRRRADIGGYEIPHGTEAGYKAHQRRGETVPEADPCGCRSASRNARRERERKTA